MHSVLELLQSSLWRQSIESTVPNQVILGLTNFLNTEQRTKTIYPPADRWFRALNQLAAENVKVVILGQDPYHGQDQAQGLSFSVSENHKLPPSLKNIFKEIESDTGQVNQSGDLSNWVDQGVLLINAVLTVEASKAGSHAKKGWESITDAVIGHVSAHCDHVVFLLWGAYAEKKLKLIDEDKHLVLTSVHPSPLSAYRGWFGSRHFSQTNTYLQAHNRKAIDWATDEQSQLSLLD